MDQIGNTVFFGSNAFFSLGVLDNLIESGNPPAAIIIPEFPGYQFGRFPHMPVGNSNGLIKRAKILNIEPVFAPQQEPHKLVHQLSARSIDFILVACWPYKLSSEVCRLANKASMNLHPSLLPKYRGANPVEEQLSQRESDLGVSLHLLSDEFDSGDIVKQSSFALSINPDRKAIEQKAADIGVQLFLEACREFGSINWQPRRQ